jgi:hypothetical protein
MLRLFYWQMFSECQQKCAETEAVVSGDGGSGKRRRRQW